MCDVLSMIGEFSLFSIGGLCIKWVNHVVENELGWGLKMEENEYYLVLMY